MNKPIIYARKLKKEKLKIHGCCTASLKEKEATVLTYKSGKIVKGELAMCKRCWEYCVKFYNVNVVYV